MRQCTIYRHSDSSARIVPWAKPDEMTDAEVSPEGAEIIMYTKLTHDEVEYLLNATKDKVSEHLSSYLP